MELPITTPALLFPAIAILMLGYINRYIGTANVVRSYRKDHASGYVRKDIKAQLAILRRRLEYSRSMITFAALALILACLSMFLIFISQQLAGEVVFGLSLLSMIISSIISLYETRLSNKSLIMEMDDMLMSEKDG